MVATVPYPTYDELHAAFSYDAATGSLRWKRRADRLTPWNNKFAGKEAGTTMPAGYRLINLGGRGLLGHRIAWIMVHGDIPLDRFIDHRNGNTSDNSIDNLRLCTMQQNLRNRIAPKPLHKLPIGVTLRNDGKYSASIRIVMGSKKFLGAFSTPDEAHKAYRVAAEKHHGEFSILARVA